MIGIKAVYGRAGDAVAHQGDPPMITPFLAMVLAGYAAFIVALMVVWLRDRRGDTGHS